MFREPDLYRVGIAVAGHRIVSAGAERAYLMYVPADNGDALPLVFSFHGSGGVPQNQVDTTWDGQWDDQSGIHEGLYDIVLQAGDETSTPVEMDVSLTDRAPEIAIESPTEDGEVRGVFRVTGTVKDARAPPNSANRR